MKGYLTIVIVGGLLFGSCLLTGCGLFRQETVDEDAPVILVDNVAEEGVAIESLFYRYALAMTTKDEGLFKSVFSEKHSLHYQDEITAFRYIVTHCDMEMTVHAVKSYYLSETEATVEVVLDTRYTYVPEEKRDVLKDFRLTTRFHLLKIEGRWVIEHNIKKYIQKTPLEGA